MHDELGQQLTATKMEIALAQRTLARLNDPRLEDGLSRQLQSLRGMVDQSVASVRRISVRLRPDVLDKLRFGDALRWLVDDFNTRYGIPCSLSVEGDVDKLYDPYAITLFRIVQESLNNIAKHAHATTTTVRLGLERDGWHCSVTDDGTGFDETSIKLDSFGLVGMRERVESLGGSLELQTAKGQGTTLRIHLKVSEAQPEKIS
jgi:signal transduction histidine kinase